LREVVVVLSLSDEPDESSSGGSTYDDRRPKCQGFSKIVFEYAVVDGRLLGEEIFEEGVQGEGSLGGPAPVDRGLTDARTSSDFLNRHGVETALRK
jgi:hypothetical protein